MYWVYSRVRGAGVNKTANITQIIWHWSAPPPKKREKDKRENQDIKCGRPTRKDWYHRQLAKDILSRKQLFVPEGMGMILQRSGQEHSRQKKCLHQGPAADYGQQVGTWRRWNPLFDIRDGRKKEARRVGRKVRQNLTARHTQCYQWWKATPSQSFIYSKP